VNPLSFEPIDEKHARSVADSFHEAAFPRWLGLRCEEVRLGYARLRLPFRPELKQGGGVVHGGAIASAIDTVVIAAVLSTSRERPRRLATIDLHVHFLDSVRDLDIVAEARVRRRGGSVVFVEVNVRSSDEREIAHGEVSCRIST
jgi:uncharacterized protein (TIGR00369 family)